MLERDLCAEPGLLSVEAAFAVVAGAAEPVSGTERVPIAGAAGRVSAEAVTSRIALPRFDQSAMDGYGVHAADVAARSTGPFRLAGAVRAGGQPLPETLPGTVVRLLTGAPVPPGIAAVVMEERAVVEGDALRLAAPIAAGENIRRRGEDVATGAALIPAGTALDARHIALLAAIGDADVLVTRRVRVGLLSTGDELADPGQPIGAAGVYDSNRPMIAALLRSPSIEIVDLGRAADDRDGMTARLADVAGTVDLVVTSGGVSGSDADHCVAAVRAAGGTSTRVSLAVKPGKPFAYGRLGATRVLSLAGNPVAAMVGTLLFARPLARRLSGLTVRPAVGLSARTASPFLHRPGRTEYVPAAVTGRDTDGHLLVEKLGRGGSARLSPLVLADGIAVIPAARGDLPAGDTVEFHPFGTDFAL
jgi:molybdopterin molybdotransferase